MNAIRVGDLVIVVRSRCCPNLIGTVYRVTEINDDKREQECSECGAVTPPGRTYEDNDNSYYGDELKRIPPLELLEAEPGQEKSVIK